MGTGFSKKKKQAKLLQEQFSQLQTKLQNSDFVGVAGNGLVTITLNGDHDVKQIKIKPDCVDPEDVEGLEDLIKAAFTDASKKIKDQSSQGIPGIQGMPDLSNFGGMFS